MKRNIHGLWFVLFLLMPLTALGQEDTCSVPDLYGTGLFLNQLIAADTAGTGWQGARGATAWKNHTRVYVLKKNGSYPYNAQFNVLANRKLVIRAEYANYAIPALGGDFRPQIYGYPVAGVPPGRFVNLNQTNDTLILKNLSICGIDESQSGSLDKNQGNMIEIQGNGSGSIYVDSCVLKTVSGQIMQIGAGSACHAFTVSLTNSYVLDMGFIGNSNLGAGRGIDCRNSEVDSLIVENNTFINWQDRLIRHYLSNLPLHSFKFNHNTAINGMSYTGMFSLGLIDSLGNGSFQIKNNLFIDNFAMGPDTDAVRQSESTDSPDNDPVKGFKMSWIVVRKNPTAHVTPWVISNNYYAITDSGAAMRNLSSPYLHTPTSTLYPGGAEPIMTSDMIRQLAANGGDTTNAFKKINITPTRVPPLMTKMIRWYNAIAGDGTGGNTSANVGAGAGRRKDGTNNTPASHFIHDVANNVWVYDFNRRTTAWYMDSLDASYKASVDLSSASSDGKVVGSTLWSFKGLTSGGPGPASVVWNLIMPDSAKPSTVVGDVTGQPISGNDFYVRNFAGTPNGPLGTTNMRWWPSSDGGVTGAFWGPETGELATRYIQLVAAPKAGSTFTVDSVAVWMLGGGTGTMRANVYGSIDPTFVTKTRLNADTINFANSGSASPSRYAYKVGMVVPSGKSFYFRIYPWYGGASSNSKYVYTQLAEIKGSTALATAVGDKDLVPKEIQLAQNYPNPFNPTTTFEYSITQSSHVVLEVFNVLGQSVAKLVDGQVNAGTYRVTYDASRLSSGVYLYRLTAGDFVQTKKMVLMK